MQGIFGGREKTEQRSQQDTRNFKVFCSLICVFELENNKEQTLDPYKRVVHGGLREHGATFMA